MIAAPMFHSWGFAHFTLAMGLCTTIVLKRKFDPEATLSLTARHGCTGLVVVPVMLQRILELDDEVLRRYDLSRAQGGAGLRLGAARRRSPSGWMDLFGDNLYNLYGSTEVAWATIATPADLRAAPGTAGRPPRGTVVQAASTTTASRSRRGETGRIFVGNELAFEGYTGGGSKDAIDGPAVVRRRRALRRRRPAVHRRPRRRHDRLGRRERLPGRGRGPARRATSAIVEAAVFGVDGRAVRAAAQGRRRAARRARR